MCTKFGWGMESVEGCKLIRFKVYGNIRVDSWIFRYGQTDTDR